jgi:hypothetical protein
MEGVLALKNSVAVVVLTALGLGSACEFAPKPPAGAFPETVAGQKKKGEVSSSDDRGIGYGYKFKAHYGEAPRQIAYEVVDHGSPEKAREGLSRGYLGGNGRVLATGGAREFASDPHYGGAVASQVAGRYVVRVAGERDAVLAFEQALPWAALGVPAWAPRTADEIQKPMPALQLLDEFKTNSEWAKLVLAGKEFRFTGVVVGRWLSKEGRAIVGLVKPGMPDDKDNTLPVTFTPGQESRVMALKEGQEVRFRGKVVFNEEFGFNLVLVEEARLEDPAT